MSDLRELSPPALVAALFYAEHTNDHNLRILSVEGLADHIDTLTEQLRLANVVIEALRVERTGCLSLTRTLHEHPDDYDGPCECRTCMSYAD